MTPSEALQSPNVRAFLRAIRLGEGTSDPDGYLRIVGGGLATGYVDHPRHKVFLPRYNVSSTAAGAYQFLSRTWDEMARKYALPDFSPESQDIAAVGLIIRRGALQSVLDGRIEEAIRKCRNEWASLPGSPYGQRTEPLRRVLDEYTSAGGQFASTPDTAAAPIERKDTMAIPAIAQVAVALAPELLKLLPWFSSGSKTSERNIKAVEAVAPALIEAAKAASGETGVIEAVEAVRSNPEAREEFVRTMAAKWSDIQPMLEFEEKSRKEARDFAERMMSGDDWRAMGFGMLLAVLALVVVVGGGWVLYSVLMSSDTSAEQKGMILGAMITATTTVIAYFFGSSAGSKRAGDAVRAIAERQ